RIRSECLGFNGAPSLDGGEPLRAASTAPMVDLLQWGPVSRRGGARGRPRARRPDRAASMGPRLSTGGGLPTKATSSWSGSGFNGAPSLDGGERACRVRVPCAIGRRFNGAPSLDGGERSVQSSTSQTLQALQWGPVSRRGGARMAW